MGISADSLNLSVGRRSANLVRLHERARTMSGLLALASRRFLSTDVRSSPARPQFLCSEAGKRGFFTHFDQVLEGGLHGFASTKRLR